MLGRYVEVLVCPLTTTNHRRPRVRLDFDFQDSDPDVNISVVTNSIPNCSHERFSQVRPVPLACRETGDCRPK